MSAQPEALRLADELEGNQLYGLQRRCRDEAAAPEAPANKASVPRPTSSSCCWSWASDNFANTNEQESAMRA